MRILSVYIGVDIKGKSHCSLVWFSFDCVAFLLEIVVLRVLFVVC